MFSLKIGECVDTAVIWSSKAEEPGCKSAPPLRQPDVLKQRILGTSRESDKAPSVCYISDLLFKIKHVLDSCSCIWESHYISLNKLCIWFKNNSLFNICSKGSPCLDLNTSSKNSVPHRETYGGQFQRGRLCQLHRWPSRSLRNTYPHSSGLRSYYP